jgi:hypothetical protein
MCIRRDSNPRLQELGPDYYPQMLDIQPSKKRTSPICYVNWVDLGNLFPYVTGYLSVSTSSAVTAQPFVQHVNHSVLFLKDRDIVLSSDACHVALNLNINTYENVLSTIKSALNLILLHKQDFTPSSELRQVETLLDNLESKLCQFKQLFPKKEPKSSLMK